MAFAPFTCALGDSPEVELQAGATVEIAPAVRVWDENGNDSLITSVDTNRVRIVGTGTITSFGVACNGLPGQLGEPATVTKRVTFVPTTPGITLTHNPPALSLLGAVNRTINVNAFGEYQSDASGNWTETQFAQAAVAPIQGHSPIVSIIYYTASATITIPPGVTRAWVRMWGGSGASGAGSATTGGSPGVGAPGYLEKFLTGLTVGGTLIFTRGAAGVAGSGVGGNGSASILASGTQTIVTLTANGSNGAPAASNTPTLGSSGGAASGGDINRTGQTGGPSTVYSFGDASVSFVNNMLPGVGGHNVLGAGPDGAPAGVTTGNAGIPGGMIIAWFNDAIS